MGYSENWKRLSAKQNVSKSPKGKSLVKKKTLPPASEKLITSVPKKSLETGKTPLESYLWGKDKAEGKEAMGKFVAMDCEFVGVGDDEKSVLARVSIVNFYGVTLLDTFVKPEAKVTNWRTWVSGVAPHHMKDAISFIEAQEKVRNIITGRTLVGHALGGDFKCLQLKHPRKKIRDTSKYSGFRVDTKGHAPSLKKLVLQHLNVEIQKGQHSSVEDARATMALFRKFKSQIDSEAMVKYK